MPPVDLRTVSIIVTPQGSAWRGLVMLGGKCVNNILGTKRAVVLDDCLAALAEEIGEGQDG